MQDLPNREEQDYTGGVLLAVALGLLALVMLVPAGGALAGLVFGGRWAWPHGHLLATLGGLATHGDTPAQAYPHALASSIPGPVPFWAVVGLLEGLALMVGVFAVVAVITRRAPLGMITRAGMKQAMRKIKDSPCAPYGTYLGVKVRPRAEDAALVIAPQQSGKTTRVAVGRIKDAPGAVVATSTKSDVLDLTIFTRVDEENDRTAPYLR